MNSEATKWIRVALPYLALAVEATADADVDCTVQRDVVDARGYAWRVTVCRVKIAEPEEANA